ncbi:MAG: hypothetical protein IKY03_00425 [Clostridia bacterium]|nr:hypothetical protein [Clostridia bacterium]
MKRFFQNIGYRYSQWMQGRYGADELSRFMTVAGVVLMVLSVFRKLSFLWFPAMAILIWSLFRVYSKNTDRRLAERNWYLGVKSKAVGYVSLLKKRWRDRKTHVYFKCPDCKKILRVPKGKGTLKVRCPQCGREIIKKT